MGESRKINKQGLLNKQGKITTYVKKNKTVWIEYVKELYLSLIHIQMCIRDSINGVLKHTFFLKSIPYGTITQPDKPRYPGGKV